MNGVSCRALGVIIDGAKSGQISLDRLTDGLGVSPEYVSNPSNQISWTLFTELMDQMGDQLDDPEQLRKFGEDNIATDTFKLFKRVGRALSHPRDIYFMGARWMGPSLFPMVSATMKERADGLLVQRLTIAEGHRDCPNFFYMIQGCLAAAPVALGHGYSDVEIDLQVRSATYTIRPSTTSSGILGRIFRAIRARVAFPSMLRELENQQFAIEESYRDLREAHAQISSQASDLAQVNAIGQRLSEHIDLTRVVDVLIRMMLEELGIPGVELRLFQTEAVAEPRNSVANAEARLVRMAGKTDGAATRCHILEAAAHPVGTLKVWYVDSGEGKAHESLLEGLLPWIAIALDNARTYESLVRHADALEQRVNERTARLLAANHHLVREIEERQRATDALMESEAQLRASERLASIGTLAAGIAHEINNPIGGILAAAQFAQVVRNDPDGEAQLTESLETIVSQTKRCGEIVRSVLQFSRDEPTQKWISEINVVVSRSLKLVEAFARENAARIVIDLPADSAWANVNPIQIEQAVVNLVRNAIESGAKRIDIGVHNSLDAPDAPDEAPDEQSVLIEVSDDGPGLADADRLRIFEPFYTTRQNIGGTGLGLSVVHGIAAEHGGSLRIRDNTDNTDNTADTADTINGSAGKVEDDAGENMGTTIQLELPTCAPPPNPLADKPDESERP